MEATRIPDEFELFERIYNYRRSVQHIEREYLDLRIHLRDAEADLRTDLQNRELKARVDYLKSRLKDLENRYPWVSTGRPSEISFCINQSEHWIGLYYQSSLLCLLCLFSKKLKEL